MEIISIVVWLVSPFENVLMLALRLKENHFQIDDAWQWGFARSKWPSLGQASHNIGRRSTEFPSQLAVEFWFRDTME